MSFLELEIVAVEMLIRLEKDSVNNLMIQVNDVTVRGTANTLPSL